MPFDQIENEKFESTRQPKIKDLTVEGHYSTNGLQTMSLRRLVRKVGIAFPNLEKLKLVIEDESIENEDANDVIDLIKKPVNEETFDLTVIFNFTVTRTSWKNLSTSYFYETLIKIPGITIIDSKETSQSELLISEKRLLKINLSFAIDNDSDSELHTISPKRRRMM